MSVSVLIPTYNCSKYIDEAIKSVLNQTFQDFEIIVVDDGSTDNTKDIVKKYDRVKYIYQEHKGIPATRNRLLDEAKGDFIAFLDSDDFYTQDKLEKQLNYLNDHPEALFVKAKRFNFSDIDEKDMNEIQKKLVKIAGKTGIAAALFRKEFFDKCGKFNEKCKNGEWDELFSRIKNMGIETTHHLEDIVYYRRIHDKNISVRSALTQKEKYALIAEGIRQFRKLDKLKGREEHN